MPRHYHFHHHGPKEKQTLAQQLKHWLTVGRQTPQVLGLLWKAFPLGAILVPLLTVATAPLPAFTLYALKKVIDGVQVWKAGDAAAGQHVAMTFFALGMGSVVLQRGIDSLLGFVQNILQARLRYHIENQVIHRAVLLDMAFYENPSFYDKLQRAEREVGYRPIQIIFAMAGGARSAVTLVSFAGVLATLAWWVVPYLLAVALPGLIVQARFGHRGWTIVHGRTGEERVMYYYRSLLTSDREAKELRLFGLGDHLIQRWRTLFWKFYKQDRRQSALRSMAEFGAMLLGTLAYAGFYVYAIYRTVNDPTVTVGSLVMYTQMMERATGIVQSLMNSISGLYENHLYLGHLFEYLQQKPQVTAPAEPREVPDPIRQGVRLEGVSFQYPGAPEGRYALENISLEIRAGEKIALVGENGAGKTTIVKLLSRLYDPQHGRITVDGVDLRQMDPAAWQKQIGVIFQDFARYSVTARENIGFGELSYLEDMERIHAAAGLSGADQCIQRLPKQWDNVLGKRFDDGQELSVGEWQKVALARAFLRDAQILVLDEPTASLDAKQEYELFRRFNDLTAGKTTVLISHRFSSVRMADRIFVVEHGHLAEAGSHEELMDLNGRYAELFTRQAAAYR